MSSNMDIFFKQLIDFSVLIVVSFDLIGLSLPVDLLNFQAFIPELYIVVQAQNIKSESGQPLNQLDFKEVNI